MAPYSSYLGSNYCLRIDVKFPLVRIYTKGDQKPRWPSREQASQLNEGSNLASSTASDLILSQETNKTSQHLDSSRSPYFASNPHRSTSLPFIHSSSPSPFSPPLSPPLIIIILMYPHPLSGQATHLLPSVAQPHSHSATPRAGPALALAPHDDRLSALARPAHSTRQRVQPRRRVARHRRGRNLVNS